MSLPRLDHATHIADQLNNLAAVVKTRSRASLTDANRILETISARFFNALFGWQLVNLNAEQANYPAADLGDRGRRIAIQITNEENSDKIKHTAAKAVEHRLGTDFDRLIVFFLLPRKPGLPKNFTQPTGGPKIETWDITDLLKQLQDLPNLDALARAARVLEVEMGKNSPPSTASKIDISRITKYAPAQLIGREAETKGLAEAWQKTLRLEQGRPHLLTFVALGGEGKTALVAKWAAELAAQDWPGCDAAFAWSFYSQGTREQLAASSDLFLKEALTFFGDDADQAFAASNAGAFEKGQRLARLVGQRRSLLILDGLEPLQYAPTAPTPGELKDQGIAALLKGLAAASHGLCVVTTRYSLPDLKAFWQTTAPEVKLLRLSRNAGVHLLKTLGVTGTAQEFETLVEDVKGHALTLTLLGSYLRDAHGGDIRKRDLVKMEEADTESEHPHHAFHVMDAYVKWLESSGAPEAGAPNAIGERTLAILRLIGLFDRPADAGCLSALMKAPAIPGLTDPLIGLNEAQRNIALKRLQDANLLTVNRDAAGALASLDAHPLLREYFARQLRESNSAVWQAAHNRIYEHLKTTTIDKPRPDLDDLEPLFQAVFHGCLGGKAADAFQDVYYQRIQRREDSYATWILGVIGAINAALANFFEKPWTEICKELPAGTQIDVLKETAFVLRVQGRPREAIELLRQALMKCESEADWKKAARVTCNLRSNHLMLGEIHVALNWAELSVKYADDSRHPLERIRRRLRKGVVLHQLGQWAEAWLQFREAESLQKQRQPQRKQFYSFGSYHCCNLLLDLVKHKRLEVEKLEGLLGPDREAICREVQQRAEAAIRFGKEDNYPPDVAINGLSLAESQFLQAACFHSSSFESVDVELEEAISGLRVAGRGDYLPHALLVRACLQYLTGETGKAKADLDEAWEIAERGPMKLHMADIHLYRARLFFRATNYPWNQNPDGTPRGSADDLAAAEKLINQCGYHRRDEELADAKRAILG